MTHRFATLVIALLFVVAVNSNGFGKQQGQQSQGNQEKIAALNDAYKNGLMTKQEYDAKLRELTGSAPGTTSGTTSGTTAGTTPGMGTPYFTPGIGTKQFGIFDPVLGANYIIATLPADWNFQGGLIRESSCEDALVTGFYRATSPDGLAGTKMLPRYDWGWSTNAPYNLGPDSDCPAHEGPISAEDFLQMMVKMLNVTYVGDNYDEATHENMRRQGQPRRAANGLIQSSDNASGLATFKINSIEEQEILNVSVLCEIKTYMPRFKNVANNVCTAIVDFTWAPVGRAFPTAMALGNANLKKINPVWGQRRGMYQRQKTQELVGQIIANGEIFRHGMDVRFQQHEEMMQIMQRGSDMQLNRFNRDMNAKQQMADDTCDALLGQQKRYDPATRTFYKTDSEYTYDWVNAQGQHYLTKDINDNPNGRGAGSFNLTTNVH